MHSDSTTVAVPVVDWLGDILNPDDIKKEPVEIKQEQADDPLLDPNVDTDPEDVEAERLPDQAPDKLPELPELPEVPGLPDWLTNPTEFRPDPSAPVSARENISPEEDPVRFAAMKSAPDAMRAQLATAGPSRVTKSTAGRTKAGPKSKTRNPPPAARNTASKKTKVAPPKVSSGPSPNRPPPAKRARPNATATKSKPNQPNEAYPNAAILPDLSPDKMSDSNFPSGSTDDEMGDQSSNLPSPPSPPPQAAISSPEKPPEKDFRQLLIEHVESQSRIKYTNPSAFMERIETPEPGDHEDLLSWVRRFPHTYFAVLKKPQPPLTQLQEALYSRMIADCDKTAYSFEDPLSGDKIKWVGYYYAHGHGKAETTKDLEEYSKSLKEIMLQDLENERNNLPFSERELRPKFADKMEKILAAKFSPSRCDFSSQIGLINLRSRFLSQLDSRYDSSIRREASQWIECPIRLGPSGDLEVICPHLAEIDRASLLYHGLNIRVKDDPSQSFIALISGFAKSLLVRGAVTAGSSLPFGDRSGSCGPIVVLSPINSRQNSFKIVRSRCEKDEQVTCEVRLIPGLATYFYKSLCLVQSSTAENNIFQQIQKPSPTIQPEPRTPFNIVSIDFRDLGPTQRRIILYLLSAVSSKIGSDILVVDHSRTELNPNSFITVYDLLFVHTVRYFITWKHELRTLTWPDYKLVDRGTSKLDSFIIEFENKIGHHFTLTSNNEVTREWKKVNSEIKQRATEPLKMLIVGDQEPVLQTICHLLLEAGEKVFYSNPRDPGKVVSVCLSKMKQRPEMKDTEHDELCMKRKDLAQKIEDENVSSRLEEIQQFLASLCKRSHHCIGLLDDVLMDNTVYQHFKDHPFSVCLVSGVEKLTDADISSLMKLKFSKLILLGDLCDLQSSREKNVAFRMLQEYSTLHSQLDSVTQAPVISPKFQVLRKANILYTPDRFCSTGDTNFIHGNRHSSSAVTSSTSPGNFNQNHNSNRNGKRPLFRGRFTIPKMNRQM